MNLIEALMRAQGGGAVQNLGQQFGLDETQTRAAMEQLAPTIAAGMRRNAQDGQGMADLLRALQGGRHERYVDDPASVASADTVADGNGILGHIFGGKDVSREVANRAAQTTGIGSSILKQMLPVIASMVMGSLSQKSRQQPGLEDIVGDLIGGALGGNKSQGNDGGGLLGDVLGGLLGGEDDSQGNSQRQSAPQRRQPSLQDVFGDLLDDKSGGNAADDLLSSVLRQTGR